MKRNKLIFEVSLRLSINTVLPESPAPIRRTAADLRSRPGRTSYAAGHDCGTGLSRQATGWLLGTALLLHPWGYCYIINSKISNSYAIESIQE